MNEGQKNINTTADFENRTGVVVWLNSKRHVKRLMNFGVLHYVSSKMDYALLYVDTKDIDRTIDRLNKENYVKKVEVSLLRDLPITYDDVITEMQKEIDDKNGAKQVAKGMTNSEELVEGQGKNKNRKKQHG